MIGKLVSAGPSGNGTRVFLENGEELQGLRKVTLTAEVDSLNVIEAEILITSADADGEIKVFAQNPATGILGEVQSITFADGGEWSAP